MSAWRSSATLILGLALGATACSGARGRVGADAGPVAQAQPGGGAPPWLPGYSPAQLALLRPVEVAIQVRASRVFPDLARFAYADNRRLDDPRESMRFTRMVATVLHDSPRFYWIDEAAPELANSIAQYGPTAPAEADAWQVTQRGADGVGTLVPVDMSAGARGDFDRGSAAYAKGDLEAAAVAFRAGLAKSPAIGLHLSLGEALTARGDAAGARAAFEAALAVDPTFASAHRGLAELAMKGGDLAAARKEIAEALAYHPSSKRSLEVADQITYGAATAGRGRVRPFPIFIDVDSVGAVHVGSTGGIPVQIYASCRAVVRYEPEVRAALFKQPASTPYFLSVMEEVVCLESAIGAYLFEQSGTAGDEDEDDDSKRAPPERSPELEALLEMAGSEGLSAYVMFEILGQHRPERARAAPPALHEAMVRYVNQHVLGSADDNPPGSYTAAL